MVRMSLALAALAAAGALPALAAEGLAVRELAGRVERGEKLDPVDRQLASEAYRQWRDSESEPGAAPGNPAVGRAFQRLSLGEPLSHEERQAFSSLVEASRQEALRADASRPGGAEANSADAGLWRGGGDLARYGALIAAGVGSVALVTALAALRMRRRSA